MISKIKLPQALTLSFATTNAEDTSPNNIKMLSLNKLMVGINLCSNNGLSKFYIESSESDNLQLNPVAIKFAKSKFCLKLRIYLLYLLLYSRLAITDVNDEMTKKS